MTICPICARTFELTRSTQKYCSRACGHQANITDKREAMRQRRHSFTPHPCLGCGAAIIGRALRCAPCRKAERARLDRERNARADVKAAVNARRKQWRRENPEAVAAMERRKWGRVATDPERHAAARERRREYERQWAAKRRAEREAAALEALRLEARPGPARPPKPAPPARKCAWCGVDMEDRRRWYCSTEHMRAAREVKLRARLAAIAKPPRPCLDCGTMVSGQRKRCPACARKAKRAHDAHRRKLTPRQRAAELALTDPEAAEAMLMQIRERERQWATVQRARRRAREQQLNDNNDQSHADNHPGHESGH